jgi:hypothetical protein
MKSDDYYSAYGGHIYVLFLYCVSLNMYGTLFTNDCNDCSLAGRNIVRFLIPSQQDTIFIACECAIDFHLDVKYVFTVS